MIPVPQSGPIRASPFACAFCFNFNSSSTVTLSLNINTFNPSSSALSASNAAYAPGIEITARFASGIFLRAVSQDFTLSAPFLSAFAVDCFLKNSSVSLKIVSNTDSSTISATITISFAEASINSAVSKPLCLKISLFAGVAIMIEALFTPSIVEM